MKKLYSFMALFGTAALLSLSIGARETKTLHALDGREVPISSIAAWKFAGGYDITTAYSTDGVKLTVPGADTVGDDAWWHRPTMPNDGSLVNGFSLEAYGSLTLEFSVGYYDNSGNQISKSRNGSAFDIAFYRDSDCNNQIARFRIWTDAAGWNNGSHSSKIYSNGWGSEADGKWIIGDATLESSFYLQLDKEDFLSSYANGSTTPIRLGDDEWVENNKSVLNGVDNVWVRFEGDNGFTNSTDIILRSINGQSLANDGVNFIDTVAPAFLPASVPESLTYGEEYTIPTEAFDLLGAVSYEIAVGDAARVTGKTFTPNQTGSLSVALYAIDAVGNENSIGYNFNVVQTIDPPTFTSLPQIESQNVDALQTITFDMPEIEDSTGTATVVLDIYFGGEKIKTLEKNADNLFEMVIPTTFESGEYTFIYRAENAGGETSSDPITATLTLNEFESPDFVTVPANSYAAYTDEGIYCKTLGNWVSFGLGVFDFSEGFDFKFRVLDEVMDNAAVALHIVNDDDPNYVAEYRVWIGFSGGDRPTNVYISRDGWHDSITDITDTGWIKRTVDDVENQYHMAYSVEETFMGERLGGMQRVDRAYDALVSFFNDAPSSNFRVYFSLGKDGAAFRAASVSEINGQGLVYPITWNNAYLALKSNVPEQIAVNEQLTIKAYAKDLRQDCVIALTGTDPDGDQIEQAFVDGSVNYTFTKTGAYHLVVSTTGANGQEVKIEKDVLCKTSTAPVTITVDGEYQATYQLGSQVAILGATYSDSAVEHSIFVTEPDSNVVVVAAGDNYTFAKPGLYKITYTAQDDAQPEPNRAQQEFVINVPDTADPVITIDGPATAKVNKEVAVTVTVTDDSAVDVTVTLAKPNGESERLTGEDGVYKFTPDATGEYQFTVVAEDLYGNSATQTLTITVKKPAAPAKGCGGSVVATSVVLSSLALAGLGLIFANKRKEK